MRSEIIRGEEISGLYDVVLYGARNANDVETIAVLDRVGDAYTFEPYAPDYDFKVMKGVPASEAVEHAGHFVGWHRSLSSIQMSAILDNSGEVTGYELRPLYQPIDFGYTDVMHVTYRIHGEKVMIYIRLKPGVQSTTDGNGIKGPWIGK